MIAVANFIGLPLMFLSSILIPPTQMPDWMRGARALQPGELGRAAPRGTRSSPAATGARAGSTSCLLLAATAVTSLFATWCFRAYQRSI